VAERKKRRQIEQVTEHLRETLTYDMAAKAYQCRYGKDLPDDEYEEFVNELINEHFNAELDEWDDKFLYYD
jgi:hypothetical protein